METLGDKLKERFGSEVVSAVIARGEITVGLDRDSVPGVFRALRDEPEFAFNFLSDLTAVDWPERTPRFDVVYHLKSLKLGHRLRVKVPVDAGSPWVHSVIEIWKAADWLERECFDMFGIRFEGHPDLRRILLYDAFEGHPLRKDYPVDRRQPIVEEVDPVIHPLRPSR